MLLLGAAARNWRFRFYCCRACGLQLLVFRKHPVYLQHPQEIRRYCTVPYPFMVLDLRFASASASDDWVSEWIRSGWVSRCRAGTTGMHSTSTPSSASRTSCWCRPWRASGGLSQSCVCKSNRPVYLNCGGSETRSTFNSTRPAQLLAHAPRNRNTEALLGRPLSPCRSNEFRLPRAPTRPKASRPAHWPHHGAGGRAGVSPGRSRGAGSNLGPGPGQVNKPEALSLRAADDIPAHSTTHKHIKVITKSIP